MEVRALATDQPVSPQKVRLVLNQIKGMPVPKAMALLEFLPQPSARMVRKLVGSAAANAENNFGIDPDELVVKTVAAGDGRMLKRYKARSRGRAAPRLKRYAHIEVILEGGEL
ncbi:MAG: 50S ribosomal protein L22 [Chloroflexi bacterium]|nr:50S ribosomal protein L22 [Chloroflexota bacterium]|tara:strand:+ start:2227 stop:2565 length:339 start_codon:yes stop_codon:yes gene_type:complete